MLRRSNEYSWLQPLTVFRYPAPIAPAVALLAIRAVAQSILITAAHSNDIKQATDILLHRRLAFVWADYLGQFGAPEGLVDLRR